MRLVRTDAFIVSEPPNLRFQELSKLMYMKLYINTIIKRDDYQLYSINNMSCEIES